MSLKNSFGLISTIFITLIAVGSFIAPTINEAAPAEAVRCNVSVSSAWTRGPTPKMRIEAFSDGPTCAKAVVVHVIRNSGGLILYQQSYESQHIATTQNARTLTQMRAALRSWTDTTGPNFLNASLPNWLAGAEQPEVREFGFMPSDDITRADYLAIRSSRAPIVCHVQGMESLYCLVWRNNELRPLGIQRFPG